jgi:hypothetical protein
MQRYKTSELRTYSSEILYDNSPSLITNRNIPIAYVIPVTYLRLTGNQALLDLLQELERETA